MAQTEPRHDADAPPAIEPTETVTVATRTVACDGGKGALGHPRVFLHIGAEGRVLCPYCSRLFVLEAGADDGGPAH